VGGDDMAINMDGGKMDEFFQEVMYLLHVPDEPHFAVVHLYAGRRDQGEHRQDPAQRGGGQADAQRHPVSAANGRK